MATDRRSWRSVIPLAAAGGTFTAFATLWLLGLRSTYFALLYGLGVPAFRFPFLDTQAILAAVECHRAGIDVYRIDPCDALGRIHVYSPLWLRADVLPITTQWTPWVGLSFVTLFLASLALLPQTRGRAPGLLMALASMSPPVLFAMERGNNDLLVFAMAAATAALCVRGSRVRVVGNLFVLVAAALKYYPLALLILVLRERPKRCVIILAASVTVLGAALLLDLHEVVGALRLVPRPSLFAGGFGARNLPFGLARLFGWPNGVGVALLMALTLATISIAWTCAGKLQNQSAALPNAHAAFLVTGAALIVGCFFAAQNIEYRDIHLLLLLPGLIRLSSRPSAGRRLATYTTAIVMLELWTMTSALAAIWVVKELGWWWIVAVASAILWNALRTSPIARLGFRVVRYAGYRQRQHDAAPSYTTLPTTALAPLHHAGLPCHRMGQAFDGDDDIASAPIDPSFPTAACQSALNIAPPIGVQNCPPTTVAVACTGSP